MRSPESLDGGRVGELRYILTDIDDTLTEDGKLLPEAFEAMWQLAKTGFRIIPVTGPPAGWCDMIIRQWPVDAVVGENGAFVYYSDYPLGMRGADVGEAEAGPHETFIHPSVGTGGISSCLSEVKREVLRRVPEVRCAKDQPFRIYDLAIDYRED
jgi:1,2-diacylglycerol 3-alpha-glucosyltransferase